MGALGALRGPESQGTLAPHGHRDFGILIPLVNSVLCGAWHTTDLAPWQLPLSNDHESASGS